MENISLKEAQEKLYRDWYRARDIFFQFVFYLYNASVSNIEQNRKVLVVKFPFTYMFLILFFVELEMDTNDIHGDLSNHSKQRHGAP